MYKCLVTGGAGYIGSHVCKALAQAGFLPIVYDNLITGHTWAAKWGPLEIGDISDRERLDSVISQYQPDAILHFAAFAYVGESVALPGKYYRNNIVGSLTLLEAMRDHQINKIVFSSTCTVYGNPKTVPIVETDPLQPVHPYAQSKVMMEQMLQAFDHTYGIKSISLRYFNAAGSDPDREIGEIHDPETHLIPNILLAALGKKDKIVIYGDDYETPDGTCIRDYIHVTDLASAHVLALQKLFAGSDTQAYNLGNGQGFSVLNVLQTAESVTGKPIPKEFGSRRPGDVACLVGNPSRAIQELGWQQNYADLETIIKTAWDWLKFYYHS